MNLILAYRGGAALLGWFALALQFVLMVGDPAPPAAPLAMLNFFSYFTILTNILVALALTASVARHPRSFFNRAGVRAAIALYIIVVCVVYQVLLRHQWDPQGWRRAADTLLHYVMPIAYVIDWAMLAPKRALSLKLVPGWLLYPAGYGAYAIARGAFTGFFAYPFLDAATLGYAQVGLNMAGLIGAFAALGCLLVAAARLLPQGALTQQYRSA